MNRTGFYKVSGVVLIAAVFLALFGQVSLEMKFDWEGRSMAEIFQMYHNGGVDIILAWVVFALGSFLLIPSALLLHKIFYNKQAPYLYVGTTFGVIAGFSYLAGIMRWILLAGVFSEIYADPSTSDTKRQIIEVVFQAINIYAGNSFGETIAPISHGIWLVLLGSAMMKSRLCWRWLAYAQILSGVIIACRPLEYIGLKTLASISDQGIIIWAFTLLITGILLILAKDDKLISEIDSM